MARQTSRTSRLIVNNRQQDIIYVIYTSLVVPTTHLPHACNHFKYQVSATTTNVATLLHHALIMDNHHYTSKRTNTSFQKNQHQLVDHVLHFLRGACWRSLTTIFDRQLRYEQRINQHDYSHILFILTYFHMYWRIIVLQGIYMKHMEMESKGAIRQNIKQTQPKNCKAAHTTAKYGPSTGIEVAQGHSGNDHAKAVAKRAGQGCGRTVPSSARPHLSLVVQSMHVGGGLGGFHVYLHRNRPLASIKRGGELPLNTHTHHNLRASLPPFVFFLLFLVVGVRQEAALQSLNLGVFLV